MIWRTRRAALDLSDRARVMGILNVTPDSFSDGGSHFGIEAALAHAREMIAQGVDIIDVGGESTRPGSLPVPADEETKRTAPVIRALRTEWDGLISIDTSKAAVAKAAIESGADIVNDVSGLRADPQMADVCATSRCGVVVMHMQGTPQNMQVAPHYADVVSEVADFFKERMASLTAQGIAPENICVDPGIGFGKNLDQNIALLRALNQIAPAGRPLLLGVSRKSCIAGMLESTDIKERDWPTVAITSWARQQGTMLHRVHEVRPNLQALRMTEAIMG
ncbi:MAG: dihydropteroate synthase [Verrucomicrobia bacterium]|nr:dihydropteroate synthase [Verrucomicrobiota bacterium]